MKQYRITIGQSYININAASKEEAFSKAIHPSNTNKWQKDETLPNINTMVTVEETN